MAVIFCPDCNKRHAPQLACVGNAFRAKQGPGFRQVIADLAERDALRLWLKENRKP